MKKDEKQTKFGAIQSHLKRYKSISDPIARDKYHTNRLSGYINVLRKRGWIIDSEWCTGKDAFGKHRYVKYRLVKVA